MRMTAVVVFMSLTMIGGSAVAQQTPPGAQPPAGSTQDLGVRIDAPPAVLKYHNRPITTFRATILARPPAERAAAIVRRLDLLLEHAASGMPVTTRSLNGATAIVVDGRDIFAIVPEDVDTLAGETESQRATEAAQRLQQAIEETIEMRTPARILVGVERSVGATLLFAVLMMFVFRIYRILAVRLPTRAEQQVFKMAGETARLITASRVTDLLRHVVTVLAFAMGVLLTYNWLAFVFRSFPYTRPWGESLRAFLIGRFTFFGEKIVQAIPDLFTAVLILVITRFFVRISNSFFLAAERAAIDVPWLHQDIAQPTRRIVATMLWLGGIVVAYPYLPGSDSDAFKGASVFIGLVISLGSSSVVNQMMSGLTITYSRALRRGDFVRIGETEGIVLSVGPLSSKIKTARGEEVTIPNAVVVSHITTNYSKYDKADGVFFGTSITIGYDVPWRQVRALLLLAAERTDGVRPQPPPRVRQSALHDSYVEYILLVALVQPSDRIAVMDRLHANILDAFNEYDVQITSPNYEGDPEAPKTVPRSRWFAAPAVADVKSSDTAGV
ncbi:MAG TPA: mechanosensitive ion channel domain-containing protein [Vicinamibacterales bacterium]|nr:mechanosensitive ion channel domain-containing protein [Vicinamibacterales bacterium]